MSEETEVATPLKKLAQASYDDISQKSGIQDLLFVVAYGINGKPVALMAPDASEEEVVCGKRKTKNAVDSGECETALEPMRLAATTCRWVNVGGTLRWICR